MFRRLAWFRLGVSSSALFWDREPALLIEGHLYAALLEVLQESPMVLRDQSVPIAGLAGVADVDAPGVDVAASIVAHPEREVLAAEEAFDCGGRACDHFWDVSRQARASGSWRC